MGRSHITGVGYRGLKVHGLPHQSLEKTGFQIATQQLRDLRQVHVTSWSLTFLYYKIGVRYS